MKKFYEKIVVESCVYWTSHLYRLLKYNEGNFHLQKFKMMKSEGDNANILTPQELDR